MSTFLRPPSRQLAQLAATSARSSSRPSLRIAQIHRSPPPTCLRQLYPRLYSTKSPRPPKKDDSERRQQKDEEGKGIEPEDSRTKRKADEEAQEAGTPDTETPGSPQHREPLLEGWAYLEDKQ